MMPSRTFFGVAVTDAELRVIDRIVAQRGMRSRSDLARTLFGEEADRRFIARPVDSFQHRTGQQNRRKITDETRAEIHALVDNGFSTSEIADRLALPRPTVSAIRHGRDYSAQRSA